MKRGAGLLAVAMLTFFGSGCESFTGGGWIPSAAGGKAKANFAVILTCTDDGLGGSVVSGTVEYQDKGQAYTCANGKSNSLSLHATLNPLSLPNATCENLDALEQVVFGANNIYFLPYTTQPTNCGAGGQIAVQVQDNGQTGPNHSDLMTIGVLTGLYGGYNNSGNLGGGNISVSLP